MESKTIQEIGPRRRNTPTLIMLGAMIAAVTGFSYSKTPAEKIAPITFQNPEDQSPFMIEHGPLNTIKEIKPVPSK